VALVAVAVLVTAIVSTHLLGLVRLDKETMAAQVPPVVMVLVAVVVRALQVAQVQGLLAVLVVLVPTLTQHGLLPHLQEQVGTMRVAVAVLPALQVLVALAVEQQVYQVVAPLMEQPIQVVVLAVLVIAIVVQVMEVQESLFFVTQILSQT
jgi:hypothetical protein